MAIKRVKVQRAAASSDDKDCNGMYRAGHAHAVGDPRNEFYDPNCGTFVASPARPETQDAFFDRGGRWLALCEATAQKIIELVAGKVAPPPSPAPDVPPLPNVVAAMTGSLTRHLVDSEVNDETERCVDCVRQWWNQHRHVDMLNSAHVDILINSMMYPVVKAVE